MIDESNPAGRLFRILRNASRTGDNAKVRDVWAKVLGCDAADDMELTRGVVELFNLSKEVQLLLSLVPGINKELYLDSFPAIEKAIFPLNLNTNWQQQRKHLDAGVITRLQFCAETLSERYSEESIPSEEIGEIVELVESLSKEIGASPLPLPLRLALQEELDRISTALAMYSIRGAKGVKQALQSLLGAVVVNHEALSESKERAAITLARLGELIDKLDSFASRALKLGRLLGSPAKYLLKYLSNDDGADSSDAEQQRNPSE